MGGRGIFSFTGSQLGNSLTADGGLAMFTRRLDLMNLLAEQGEESAQQIDAPLFQPLRQT